MENSNNNKKDKKDLIIKIVLVIIIILLLIHNCVMMNGNKKEDGKTPTGNVDIFEIKCDQDKCTVPVTGEGEDVTILDKNIVWESENKLRIFENPVFHFDETIAPESTNVYQFVIKNTTEYDLKYNVNFIETNQFNINMKYKLKKNDEYVIDEYVSASELKLDEFSLNKGESDTFYLEWKWVSSSNDTEVGSNPSSSYQLSIEVYAESI